MSNVEAPPSIQDDVVEVRRKLLDLYAATKKKSEELDRQRDEMNRERERMDKMKRDLEVESTLNDMIKATCVSEEQDRSAQLEKLKNDLYKRETFIKSKEMEVLREVRIAERVREEIIKEFMREQEIIEEMRGADFGDAASLGFLTPNNSAPPSPAARKGKRTFSGKGGFVHTIDTSSSDDDDDANDRSSSSDLDSILGNYDDDDDDDNDENKENVNPLNGVRAGSKIAKKIVAAKKGCFPPPPPQKKKQRRIPTKTIPDPTELDDPVPKPLNYDVNEPHLRHWCGECQNCMSARLHRACVHREGCPNCPPKKTRKRKRVE